VIVGPRFELLFVLDQETDPPPVFFLSVADKGLSCCVSGLESTDAGGFVSVDSKGVC